jgi:rhomboid protease GluP
MGSYSPTPEPEYLPPETGYEPPESPVRRRMRAIAAAPATHLLVAVNCLVFLAMVSQNVSAFNPTTGQLLNWGADHTGAVLIFGQWWRIVTAMFVHVGLIHLATNMWCLWNLGLLAEPLLGSMGLLTAYILTGAAGNLLSTFVNWWWNYGDWIKTHDLGVFPAGAGASGAVFGIAGVLIILLKSQRLPVPPLELRRLRKSVIYFAAINLVLGLSISFGTMVTHAGLSIDNMAHLGGFLCGLLFASLLVPRIGSPRQVFKRKMRIAQGMVVGLLVLFGFFLAQLPG